MTNHVGLVIDLFKNYYYNNYWAKKAAWRREGVLGIGGGGRREISIWVSDRLRVGDELFRKYFTCAGSAESSVDRSRISVHPIFSFRSKPSLGFVGL